MARFHTRKFAVVALLLGVPAGLYAATGGPDNGDYVYTDSDEADGPPYGLVALTDPTDPDLADDGTTTVSLPFTVDWYGTDYDEATISNNGVLFFDGATSTATGLCPGVGTWQGVAAYWDDWAADSVRYETVGRYPHRGFVVNWEGAHDAAGGAGQVQAWLLEGRSEAVVTLADTTFGNTAHDNGASATLGIQGTGNLDWYCNGSSGTGATISDGLVGWFGPEASRTATSVRTANSLSSTPHTGTGIGDYTGLALALDDLDGDTIADLLVGQPQNDAVYFFAGGTGADGQTMGGATASFLATASTAGNRLGASLATGDLDGDGVSDFAVGAPEDDQATTDAGAVYVVAGGAFSGLYRLPTDADLTVDGPSAAYPGYSPATWTSPEAGTTLAIADLDNDGYGDLVVGAPGEDTQGNNAGAVYVLYGASTLVSGGTASLDSADAVLLGEASGDAAGSALTFGDIEGDGDEDLLIGAPLFDDGLVSTQAGPTLWRASPRGGAETMTWVPLRWPR